MNIHPRIKVLLLLLGGTITALQSASAATPSEKSPADSGQNTAPSAAEPSQRPTNVSLAPAGDAVLTPKSLTKGTVLKTQVALTTVTNWNNGFSDTDTDLNDESLTWKTPTSYGDPDGDEFSCGYKKIDNITAQITFNQTKNSEGNLANEHGTGKLILRFTSYDSATGILYGTVVTSESYTGDGKYGPDPADYGTFVDSSSGSGIFSLKIK
ncbi:hypothetical protein [Luteolibacter sp.]|uniref:hypothetical protein n=1 Tax=Luteolibacter sp. TaxID=1962973 RepID=UPI003263346C